MGGFFAASPAMLSPRQKQMVSTSLLSSPVSSGYQSSAPQFNTSGYPARSWYQAPAAPARGALPGRKVSSSYPETYKASGAAPATATASSSSRFVQLGVPRQALGTSAPYLAQSPRSKARETGSATTPSIVRQISRPTVLRTTDLLSASKSSTPAKLVSTANILTNITPKKVDAAIAMATPQSVLVPEVSIQPVVSAEPDSIDRDLKLEAAPASIAQTEYPVEVPPAMAEVEATNGIIDVPAVVEVASVPAVDPDVVANDSQTESGPSLLSDLNRSMKQFDSQFEEFSKRSQNPDLVNDVLQAVSSFKGKIRGKAGTGKLQLSYGAGKMNLAYLKVLDKGNRVTVKGRAGQIAYFNLDGSYDVLFNDGFRENFVDASFVQVDDA